jgi:hypothetical protein
MAAVAASLGGLHARPDSRQAGAQILRSIQNFGTRGLCCVPTPAASWSAPPRCVPCRAIEEVLWPGSGRPGHPSTDPAWTCLLGTGRGHQKPSGSRAHQSVGQLGRPAHGKCLMGGLGRIPIALSSFQAHGRACCPRGRDVMFASSTTTGRRKALTGLPQQKESHPQQKEGHPQVIRRSKLSLC